MDEINNGVLLEEAKEIIEGRSETHGPPEDSFSRIAAYWSTYLSIQYGLEWELTSSDVAELMALFKLARAQGGDYNEDDYRDRLGYVNLASNLR
ncbi:hypothetical protein M192_gp065 [Halorubrum tailed phage 8]|uniref:DUF6378 domain-containing protein n=3 Tax=Haloferacalesvirus TaxID=2843389 RepID=R4T5B8_9CAUD|nr:hypothetical protein M192_gp065 [Halorubrum tailed phage 8]UBF19139.1 hypothetical protein HRTV-14_gp66 [Halorubrum phage HRTV-14]UBF19266.1 hypothetical protein HRTV-17_gp67 [Halorubrum phage HRTV-17]UBF19394.1 hypothetical protein HRTV-19_gp68 [Halorubrum virus HRTV-19]UBF19523.1 hypothetical protein HRTV-23_gp68 [Halorubrum virus HRTV-23]AGM10814.1 hypothetical protein HRTV8_68 [Halorubrum tailed phage 8]